MRYVVVLDDNKEGRNYSDGTGNFTSTRNKAFVFDDTDPYVMATYNGDAYLWARAHAKLWAKDKKKAISVVIGD